MRLINRGVSSICFLSLRNHHHHHRAGGTFTFSLALSLSHTSSTFTTCCITSRIHSLEAPSKQLPLHTFITTPAGRYYSLSTSTSLAAASSSLSSSSSRGSFEYQSLLKDKRPRPKEELLTHDQITLISELVEKRSIARFNGDYKTADLLRDEIDSIPTTADATTSNSISSDGDNISSSSSSHSSIHLPPGYKVSVKDIPRNEGGGSTWSLQPITKVQNDLADAALLNDKILNDSDDGGDNHNHNDSSGSVLCLAHAALGLASSASERGVSIDREKLRDIALKAKQRLALTGEQELRGRKAADAAFWLALAGVQDDRDSNSDLDPHSNPRPHEFSLYDALTFISLEELKRFGRKSSCRAMDIMQIIERIAASGVRGDIFKDLQLEAAECLESKSPADIEDLVRRGVIESLRRGEFELHSERSLLWIFRFSTRQKKQRAFLKSAAKHWESMEVEDRSQRIPSIVEDNDATQWGDMFDDPTRPLVVDIGCGMGVSILGLSTLNKDTSSPGNIEERGDRLSFDPSRYNYLGADLSRLAINYATCISERWCIDHRTQFVVASAEDTLEWILETYPGKVELCMIQFPTPFRFNINDGIVKDKKQSDSRNDLEMLSVVNQGNKQLPSDEFSGFMVTRRLLDLARNVLNEESGRLLIQSNVEDVAVFMKNSACESGFEPLTASQQVVKIKESKEGLPQRMRNWISIGGERAEGDIWSAVSVLDERAATETEMACFQNGTPVHRCLLKSR